MVKGYKISQHKRMAMGQKVGAAKKKGGGRLIKKASQTIKKRK